MAQYSDKEMLLAAELAYLDFNGRSDRLLSVETLLNRILTTYGNYDSASNTYTLKEGTSRHAKSQFETALYVKQLAEEVGTDNWKRWKIVDSCDQNGSLGSGYYGCLIDTGDGGVIVGSRGSESDDIMTGIKDWGLADVDRLDNPQTRQQTDATKYIQYLSSKYGDVYDSFSFAGHSLGGALSLHMAITAPEKIKKKMGNAISFDGPGFSDEYQRLHALEIAKIKEHLIHYEWSWVGAIMDQPNGCTNRIIRAHDDTTQEGVWSILTRHHPRNIEFDDDTVQNGERGIGQTISKILVEGIDVALYIVMVRHPLIATAYFLWKNRVLIIENMNTCVTTIRDKVREIFTAYCSMVVSGEYELDVRVLASMQEDMDYLEGQLRYLSEQVNDIKQNLPYLSTAGFYYKNLLGLHASAINIQAGNAKKLSSAAQNARMKYVRADEEAAAEF